MEQLINYEELKQYLNLENKFENYITSITNKIIYILNQKRVGAKTWKIAKEKYTEKEILDIKESSFCGLYLLYGNDNSGIYIGLNPKCLDENIINELKQKGKLEEDINKCFFALDFSSDKIKNEKLLINEKPVIEVLRSKNNTDLNYYYFGFEDQYKIVDKAVRIIETYYKLD